MPGQILIAQADMFISLLVERSEPVAVYARGVREIRAGGKAIQEVTQDLLELQDAMASAYLDGIATQLYAHEKWKWLKRTSSGE